MSMAQEILALDFAALRTLKLVHDHRSFAAAATELGMNPSSISYTIERVRKAANDPLFVKQGGTIAPTEHCKKLMTSVERVLTEAENFREDADFEPSKVNAEVSINVTSYETLLVLPQVVRRMRKDAPGIRMMLYNNYGSARDLLLNGFADIYLGPQRVTDSGIYGQEFLNRDHHLCMMDPSHPLARKTEITLDDIKDEDHAHFEPRPGWQQAHFRYAASQGVYLNKAIISSDAISFGEIIRGTDLLAALPARMTQRFERNLVLRPFAFDTSLAEHMYWTAAADRSQINRWVRTVFAQEAQNHDASLS